MRVLITGANGALGRALLAHPWPPGVEVLGVCREQVKSPQPPVPMHTIGTLDGQTRWGPVLRGVSHIVHCASLTRVPAQEPEATRRYRVANADATACLAAAARQAGVARIVYVSSMTVLGQHTGAQPFRADDEPLPRSDYAQSKLQAERALFDAAREGGPEVVIVRPPRLVWPTLSGNLARLESLVAKGVPLPFGAVAANRRDNLSSHNLLSLIATCVTHAKAAGQVFLAADADPMSTRELITRLARRRGVHARLLPVPEHVLRAMVALLPSSLLGGLSRSELAEELLGNLEIDISNARDRLGWQPIGRTLLSET